MAKIDNILAILWMLRSDEKVTAKQISEKLEMNIRTVYRYIDTLSMSGVPIIADAGHNGGYSLLNDFIEAPLFFDLKEQASLFHAAIFAEEAGYYGGETLNRAISKLKRYSNEEQETKINQHVTNLEVISQDHFYDSLPFLKELEEAVTERTSIKFRYYRRHEGQSLSRMVDPYKIIYWNNKWYVIGFCHLRNAIRSFRVDRMEKLTRTDHLFEQLENFSAQAFFMKETHPELEIQQEFISLIISGDKKALGDICQHWFLSKYLQEWQADQAIFYMEQSMIHKYVPHLLLPYGKSIQVIEPVSLKERIVEVLSELIAFHQI